MIKKAKTAWEFLAEVFNSWSDDNCFRLSAALSYYTLFSIAPLFVVVFGLVGLIYKDQNISDLIFQYAHDIIGPQAANGLETMVKNAYIGKPDSLSGWVSVALLIFSATVMMTALQSSLNTIFMVRIRADKGLIYFGLSRLLALGMLLIIGALLLAVVVVNAVWVAIGDYLSQFMAENALTLIEAGQLIIGLGTTTLLFALLFKYLPDARIKWKNIWIGAFTTSVLFLIGKYLISFYLGSTNLTSLYGAAGSIILLIVWINYSSWIFFLGAELIMVISRRKGDKIIPSKIAETYRHVVEMHDSWN
jgi:membrane protein